MLVQKVRLFPKYLEGSCDIRGTQHREVDGKCHCRVSHRGYTCNMCQEGYTGDNCEICEDDYIRQYEETCVRNVDNYLHTVRTHV